MIKIHLRNNQVFCTVIDEITSKKKEIILSITIIFDTVFGMLTKAEPIGVAVSATSTPVISCERPQFSGQHVPRVSPRWDKIIMTTNSNKIVPLIYINGHYSYINDELLKKLRAGDLRSNVVAIFVGVLVFAMFKILGVDAFQSVANMNAPTTNIDRGYPGIGSGVSSSLSIALAPGPGKTSTAL